MCRILPKGQLTEFIILGNKKERKHIVKDVGNDLKSRILQVR